MRRLTQPRLAAAAFRTAFTAAVSRDGVQLSGDVTHWLHPQWLIENATDARHPTGQRTLTLDTLSSACGRVESVAIQGEHLVCGLTTHPEGLGDALEPPRKRNAKEDAIFPAPKAWSIKVPLAEVLKNEPGCDRPLLAAAPVTPVTNIAGVTRVAFGDLAKKDKASIANIFTALARDGIAVVHGAPTDSETTVIDLCKILAPVSGAMHTLYGETFKVDRVATEGPRNNIAYTGEFLDLHNDIAYYESMPGLQLLHCRQFDAAVQGGATFFVDAFAAAEDLKYRLPHAFDALCRIPHAVKKYDAQRTVPAQYYYGTPHIRVNEITGQVSKVVWAPSFEASLPLWPGEGQQRQYYEARRAFATVLKEWRNGKSIKIRLSPGECVVWNQQRLLHGREAFEEPKPGMRRLHGAYVHIDDFISTCRTVLGKEAMPPVALGNGSWL